MQENDVRMGVSLCQRDIMGHFFHLAFCVSHAWFGNPHHGGVAGKPCEKLPEGSSRWPMVAPLFENAKLVEQTR